MKKDLYILTGSSSAGKSLILENFSNHFEIAPFVEKHKFPLNLPTRDICYSLVINETKLGGFVYKKDGDKLETYLPDNYKEYCLNYYLSNETCITDDFDIKECNFIITIRDPRVIWFVDDHIDQFMSTSDLNLSFNHFIEESKIIVETYKFIKKNNCNFIVLKYEDLQNKFLETSRIISDFMLIENPDIIRSNKPANKYISSLDFFEKYLFGAFYEKILNDDDDLETIERECEEYIQLFNYPKRLRKNDILEDLELSIFDARKDRIKNVYNNFLRS